METGQRKIDRSKTKVFQPPNQETVRITRDHETPSHVFKAKSVVTLDRPLAEELKTAGIAEDFQSERETTERLSRAETAAKARK